jgi:hypothetical protein
MKILLTATLILTSSFTIASQDLSEETKDFLKQNNITLVNEGITQEHIDVFRKSYERLPTDLNRELLDKGRKLRLIYGQGVSDDSSWTTPKTHDGRSFKDVVGVGGSPYWGAPTRIVVNRFHKSHGSADLYLHEEAHSIDSTYGYHTITGTKEWRNLHSLPMVKTFLKKKKMTDYYINSPEETFAELFALYYASDETQTEIHAELPDVAVYFESLRSIKKASMSKGVSGIFNILGF